MGALASAAAHSGAFAVLERLEVPMNGIGPDGAAAMARSILVLRAVGGDDDEEPHSPSAARGAPVLRELFMHGAPRRGAPRHRGRVRVWRRS